MEYEKINGNVAFNSTEHKYWDITNPDKQYISVTTLIHSYAKPYDKEFWSSFKALEKLLNAEDWSIVKRTLMSTKVFDKSLLSTFGISENDFNREQQGILDAWAEKNRKACDTGTEIHKQFENQFYSKGKDIELPSFGIGGKFECKKDYTILDLESGIYPEYLLYWESKNGKVRLAGQSDLIIKQGNNITCIDHKGLALDTPILTTEGWKTIATLQIGDNVFDKDGTPCKVMIKSEVHHNPCFKITFDNSESIIADDEHLWIVSIAKYYYKNSSDKYVHKVMSTIEIKKYLEESKNSKSYKPNLRILNAAPLQLEDKKFLIDPYVLGVWLGDGSKNDGNVTQYIGSPIWEELKKREYELSENHVHDIKRKNVESRTVYGLISKLKQIDVYKNKHIPESYMLGSYQQRLDLLRGLMDTDGYYHPKRKRFVMNTSFEWQAKDLRRLLGTLGIKSTIFKTTNQYNGKKFKGWYLCFTTHTINPFLTRNQDIIYKNAHDCNTFRTIKKVEEIESVPTQCIMVDSPSHTYLAGDSLIVTHNTNEKIDTKSYYDKYTRKSDKMQYPLNHLDDCNFNYYSMQLSTYAWMLQQINPKFNIQDLIINHYDHEGKNTLYHCKYLRDEVESMLYDYEKKLTLAEKRAARKRIEY